MIPLALLSLLAVSAGAEDAPALVVSRLQDETAARIQSGVLDPVLGPGKSSVFVRFSVESKRSDDSSQRSGVGFAEYTHAKTLVTRSSDTVPAQSLAPDPNLFRNFGFFTNDVASASARGAATAQTTRPAASANALAPADDSRGSRDAQTKEAREEKAIAESLTTISMTFVAFKVVVVYDASVPQSRLNAARQALVAAYAPDLSPTNVRFAPFSFARADAP